MQRIIYIDVTANRARVSSSSLGTQGEQAVTDLSISFDESWEGLTKRLLWRTADGAKSAFSLLSSPDADGKFTVSVPALPLSVGGWCSLTLEGFALKDDELSKRARSVQLLFYVEPNDSAASSEAQEMTPTLGEQLQTKISTLEDSLRKELDEQTDLLTEALDGKAERVHGHTATQVVCTGIDGLPNMLQGTINDIAEALKSNCPTDHEHTAEQVLYSHGDEEVPLQDALDGITEELAGKAESSHEHSAAQVHYTDDNGFSLSLDKAIASITQMFANGSPNNHEHTASQVLYPLSDEFSINLQDAINDIVIAIGEKAEISHSHTASQVTCNGINGLPNLLQGAIDDIARVINRKADSTHEHIANQIAYTTSNGTALPVQDALSSLYTALETKAASNHTHNFTADSISYNGDMSVAEAISTLISRKAVRIYRFSLSADNWAGSEAPFTRSLSIPIATQDAVAFLSVARDASDEAFLAASNAIIRTVPESGSVTLKAYGSKPSVNIPVVLTVIL